MKRTDTKECRKWWNGWGVDKMTKKVSMQKTPKTKMMNVISIMTIMVIEKESIINKKITLNNIKNNQLNKINNKSNKNLDTSLWIPFHPLKYNLINPNLLNYWLNYLKSSKKPINLSINPLLSLILILTKNKPLKKYFKINRKRKTITLLEIFLVLVLTKDKEMV